MEINAWLNKDLFIFRNKAKLKNFIHCLVNPICKNKFMLATKFWINWLTYFQLKNQIYTFCSYVIFTFVSSAEKLFLKKLQWMLLQLVSRIGSFGSTISFQGFDKYSYSIKSWMKNVCQSLCNISKILWRPLHPENTCSKVTIEILEQGVKYVQS